MSRYTQKQIDQLWKQTKTKAKMSHIWIKRLRDQAELGLLEREFTDRLEPQIIDYYYTIEL